MRELLLLAVTLQLAWGAAIVPSCPDSCTCQQHSSESIEISCNSYDFIGTDSTKPTQFFTSLHMNKTETYEIDQKLNYLKNLIDLDLSENKIEQLPSKFPYLPKLKTLNMSHNYLVDASFAEFPKRLEIVDLSHNLLTKFPLDWADLPELKTLYLHDNRIDCDCDNLAIFEQLSLKGIKIREKLTCHNPIEFQGLPLNTVNCSTITQILNEMADEGSGSDGGEDLDDYLDPLFIVADEESPLTDDAETLHEGSGDDFQGSGQFPLVDETVSAMPKACFENCSTAKPVGIDDELNASPPPNADESFNIILDDLLNAGDAKTTEATIIENAGKELEEPFVKDTDKDLGVESLPSNGTDKNLEVESVPTNDTVLGEMERASLSESGSKSVYIVVGLLLTFLVFIGIYYLNKKMKGSRGPSRRRQKVNENGFGEEMKPFGKSAEKPIQVVPGEKGKNGTVEQHTPLLNGNGKVKDDIPKVHSEQCQASPDDRELDEPSEVEMRRPTTDRELLTPQLERVTIKSGEIPDSVPRTPIFVTRKMNNDGEYVTTVETP